MALRIEQPPFSPPQKESQLQFPSYARIVEYLSRHPLTNSPFHQSIKINENAAETFADKCVTEKNIVRCVTFLMVHHDPIFYGMRAGTADLIASNIIQALIDCTLGKRIAVLPKELKNHDQ
jgi:hypothetical protein